MVRRILAGALSLIPLRTIALIFLIIPQSAVTSGDLAADRPNHWVKAKLSALSVCGDVVTTISAFDQFVATRLRTDSNILLQLYQASPNRKYVVSSALGVRELEMPSDIVLQTGLLAKMSNWVAFQVGGSGQSTQPDNRVQSGDRSLWQHYEYYIIAFASLAVIESIIIACLLFNHVRRRRYEVTARSADAQFMESLAHFRTMADNAPVMMWVSGPDELSIWFNKTWSNFVGRPIQLDLGNAWADIIHRDDLGRYLETYKTAFDARQPFSIEYRLKRHDDEYRWVVSEGAPLYGLDGTFSGFIGSIVDITENERVQDALQESQAQLAGMIDSAMDAMITVKEGRRIVRFNTAAEKMFGCSAQQAVGRSVDRFILEDFRREDRQQVVDFSHTKAGKRSNGLHWALSGRRADGTQFPIEASISQTKINGHEFCTFILRDITGLLKADAALRESEALYKAIFDGVIDAIIISDKETGAILDVNQGMCEMYGLTDVEARQFTLSDLSADEPPYTQSELLTRISKAAAGEPQNFEWRAKDKSGRAFWVKVGLRRFALQGTDRLLATVRDNSNRKRSEEAFAELDKLKSQLDAESVHLHRDVHLNHDFSQIIGKSDGINIVLSKIEQVAPTDTTVLILGETGSGKDLVAHAIHRTSHRKDKPLVNVNCATLPATLIESELFGHERGAFTSAITRQQGRFELADGGTIFLDEIGDLPLELQGKLLRVLQDGEFERLGSGKTIKVNARIIAATNRDLTLAVQKGQFREDLLYRVNVYPLTIPPLRERKEDIPLLVESYVRRFSKELGKTIDTIAPATMAALHDYSWPGNVRELSNVIERAVINTEDATLRLTDNLNRLRAVEPAPALKTLEDLERDHILRVLEETGWRIEGPSGAARILALHPSTLRTRMAKLGIEKPKTPMQLKLSNEY